MRKLSISYLFRRSWRSRRSRGSDGGSLRHPDWRCCRGSLRSGPGLAVLQPFGFGQLAGHDAVCAKMRTVSLVSSTVMEVALALPRLKRIWRAEASNCLPSSVVSLIALNGNVCAPRSKSSGLRRQDVAHFAAAIISGARMRPSLSVSINESVLASNSRPCVGQASATQSFWSN